MTARPAPMTATIHPSADRSAAGDAGAAICIRPLTSLDDLRACVELQREVWGWDQADTVPATLLHVVEYVGGLVAGAFDERGALLGFVFGISGPRNGELAHWSHMLGVRQSARDSGVGRMLKEYQRSAMAAAGITRIYWSFDPLMAKNAYFNLNRLGTEVVEYVPDMYGTTGSPLHYGLATDRLVVSLDTTDAAGRPRRPKVDFGAPILSAFPQLTDVALPMGDACPDAALIEIPADVLQVMAESPDTARMWRLAVREHFQWALSHGYSVVGLRQDRATNRSFYVAVRDSSEAVAA